MPVIALVASGFPVGSLIENPIWIFWRDSVGGAMGKVVRNTSQLGAEDRAAMTTYLKSLPPVEGPRPPAKKE